MSTGAANRLLAVARRDVLCVVRGALRGKRVAYGGHVEERNIFGRTRNLPRMAPAAASAGGYAARRRPAFRTERKAWVNRLSKRPILDLTIRPRGRPRKK